MQEWRFLGVTFICKSSKILLHSRFSEKIVTLKVCKLMKSMKIIWCHKINWIIWDFICTLNNRFIPNLVYTQMGVIERCSEVPQASNFIKNRLWHRCFPVNFVKFIRAPFLTEHFWWLLLFTAKFALLICQGFNSVCTISLVLHHLHEFYFFPYNFYLFLDIIYFWIFLFYGTSRKTLAVYWAHLVKVI